MGHGAARVAASVSVHPCGRLDGNVPGHGSDSEVRRRYLPGSISGPNEPSHRPKNPARASARRRPRSRMPGGESSIARLARSQRRRVARPEALRRAWWAGLSFSGSTEQRIAPLANEKWDRHLACLCRLAGWKPAPPIQSVPAVAVGSGLNELVTGARPTARLGRRYPIRRVHSSRRAVAGTWGRALLGPRAGLRIASPARDTTECS
jgi:hypothetical protein